jgi:hypothetical protein
MIVQWCCKGIAKIDENAAWQILADGIGLRCRHWLELPPYEPFPVAEALRRLTERDLDLHVNNYSYRDPGTARPFYETTPFISLSAGCVERDATIRRYRTHRALRTALQFATRDFSLPDRPRCAGWVFTCYVLVGVNKAVTIPSVAEEIRELNHNRAYSDWYPQGEITAKINVPSTQILCAVRWEPSPPGALTATDVLLNLVFTHPAALLDERNML